MYGNVHSPLRGSPSTRHTNAVDETPKLLGAHTSLLAPCSPTAVSHVQPRTLSDEGTGPSTDSPHLNIPARSAPELARLQGPHPRVAVGILGPFRRLLQHLNPDGKRISYPVEPTALRAEQLNCKSLWPAPPSGQRLKLLSNWVEERDKALSNPLMIAARENAEYPRHRVQKVVPSEIFRDINCCLEAARWVEGTLHLGAANRPLDFITAASFTETRIAVRCTMATRKTRFEDLGIQNIPAYFEQAPNVLHRVIRGLVAQFYGAGQCGERAALALVRLIEISEPGAEVAMVVSRTKDHAFVLYRSRSDNPWVVCDPWLRREQACLASDYHLLPEGCSNPFGLEGENAIDTLAKIAVTPETKSDFADMNSLVRARFAHLPPIPPDWEDGDWVVLFRNSLSQYMGMDVRAHRDPGTALDYISS